MVAVGLVFMRFDNRIGAKTCPSSSGGGLLYVLWPSCCSGCLQIKDQFLQTQICIIWLKSYKTKISKIWMRQRTNAASHTSDLDWTLCSLSSGVWPERGAKTSKKRQRALHRDPGAGDSLCSSIPRSRFVCPSLVSLQLMLSQGTVELAVAEIVNIWNRKCLWCLGCSPQISSLSYCQWIAKNCSLGWSMQIPPASGFSNFLVDIKCLIAGHSTAISAAESGL